MLLLLCAVFAALGHFQGPKLETAQVDSDQAVLRSGQQLRLFANQQLADVDPDDVTITPAVDFSVSTSAAIIAVQFDAPLLYDAHYVVEVAGVTNAAGGQPSTLSYEFATGSPPIYYLDRADSAGAVDEIVRTGVRGAERTVVYSAAGILDFALIGQNAAAVSSIADDGTSALSLVSFDDGGVEPVALPAPGTIESLQSADDGVTIGFLFTAADGSAAHELMALNLDAGRSILPVAGLDGAPLPVTDWFFVPGGVSLIAHTDDERVLQVDTGTGAVTPLGTFTSLESLSTDATRLAVTNPFGPVVLTLADLTDTEFAASPVDGVIPFPGDFQLMRGGGLVQHVVTVSYETSDFTNMLVYDDGSESRQLFRTIDDRGSIGDFAVMPNDQYVAVEVVPAVETAVSDGYPVDERATSVTTILIDIAAGAVVKTVAGFALQW